MKMRKFILGVMAVVLMLSAVSLGAQELYAVNAVPGIQPGSILVLVITADASAGSVWGTGSYTLDSSIQAAAVHAGALPHKARGTVILEVVPGESSYRGSVSNGVSSGNWGAYGMGFRFLGALPSAQASLGSPSLSGSAAATGASGASTGASGAGGSSAAYAPARVYGFEDSTAMARISQTPGTTAYFRIAGSTGGRVWGTGIYTFDSSLETAAVHAGILAPGQTGIIKVTVLAGRSSYDGTSRNGVTTSGYSAYGASYSIEKVASGTQFSTVISDPGSPRNISGVSTGQTYAVWVTGSAASSGIWGSGIYTSDSPLSVAAVHAGILSRGESGAVLVRILPGQSSYAGTTNHGVTSSAYGGYGMSYSMEALR